MINKLHQIFLMTFYKLELISLHYQSFKTSQEGYNSFDTEPFVHYLLNKPFA